MVGHWNGLYRDVVGSPLLETVKTQLNIALNNLFLQSSLATELREGDLRRSFPDSALLQI